MTDDGVLALPIVSRTMDLPEDLAEATGCQRIRVLVSDKTPRPGIHVPCDREGCEASARVYEGRIQCLLDHEGNEIDLSEMGEDIQARLLVLNHRTQLCLGHIFHLIAEPTDDEDEEES
jgi:hypothetical protein